MIKIDQAFTSALLALEPELDVVWENQNYSVWGGAAYAHFDGVYSPTSGRPYIEAFLLPNDVTGLSLASSNETDGLFRCILRYPHSSGSLQAKQKADEIFEAFPIAGIISYDGQGVVINGHQRQPGVAEDGWYKLVLSISYRAKLMR